MLEYFFTHEIQQHQESFFQDCDKHGCYANVELVDIICMMYKNSKLN